MARGQAAKPVVQAAEPRGAARSPSGRFWQCRRGGNGAGVVEALAGLGRADLVFVPGFISNLDVAWEEPGMARFFSRLAAFSRLIMFDKRGTGLSDRVAGIACLENRMDDVRAVMDAAESERAALFGFSEGGAMSMLFAATYPERVRALIVYGTRPVPRPENWVRDRLALIDRSWGAGEIFGQSAPARPPMKLIAALSPAGSAPAPARQR